MNGEYQLLTINTSVSRNSILTMNGRLHENNNYTKINGDNEEFPLPEKRFGPGGGVTKAKARSYSRWSPTEQGATLVWRDVCVYAQQTDKRQKIKRIINNVSGAVTPGTLVALMGSSGAGKDLSFRNDR